MLNKLCRWRQLQNRGSPPPLLLPSTDQEEDLLAEEVEVEALLMEDNQEDNLHPSSL